MKHLIAVLLGAVSLSVALPAAAAPDFWLIEQGRKAKRAKMEERAARQDKPVTVEDCMQMMKKT